MKTLPCIGLALIFASAQLNYSATIGSIVWNDLNGNGIQDTNEPGVDAVTLKLFSCANNNLLGTQVTTNGGTFEFSGTLSTQVFLRITLPDGYEVTAANQGTNDLIDSDVDPDTLRTPCITLDCTNAQGTNCVQSFWNVGLVQECTNILAGPGFWKSHPEAWPVTNITIGGSNYMSSNAASLLKSGRDKSLTLFRALLATRLNILASNESSCITQAVAQAEEWLAENPRWSNVRGSSDAWKEASEIMDQLEAYNKGELCAERCDRKPEKPPRVEVRPREDKDKSKKDKEKNQHHNEAKEKNQQRKEAKLRLRIISEPGQIFTVERSTNLSNWVAVATVTNQFGIHEFLSDLTPETNVFYRVIVSGETAGTDEPLNVFGTFKEVGDDEEVELLPIVYDGDLVIKGDNNEISGSAPGETVIAGNLIIKGSDNVISDLTVLGDVLFQGDDNSLDDVDHEGDVFDSGTGNDL